NGNGAYMASLTIGSGARLNANLLVYRATLDFSGNTLAIGNTLTLIAGSASELLNIPTLSAGQSLTLFTGVDSFSTDWFGGSEEAVTVDDASTIFSNLTSGTYSLKYTGAAAGGDVLLIANNPTPEPTTATLSLLALMGLAARRRRKA
ncbi:MAG: PEP-CTERM sorting domain-containing protein, partial [Akkermansia sp.]